MFNFSFIVVTLIIATKISASSEISSKLNVQDFCSSRLTCSACLQSENCIWCLDHSMTSNSRCFPNSLDHPCKEEHRWNPINEQTIVRMDNLSRPEEYQPSQNSLLRTFTPQAISLKLRISQKQRIQVQYAQIEHYPIDVYLLMDMSKSMADDKVKVYELGDSLAQNIGNVTLNIRLGFGSFVGKTDLNSVESCDDCEYCEEQKACDVPYVFKNHMALTPDITQFSKKLRQIPTSNLNSSGGGIDAIMRAIDEIEWRQASRRILVVATNSVSQYVENANGQVFTNYMTGEVPSIKELDKKVRQNQVNILFAVTTPVYRTYENIVYEITGSSIGTLDSANIVELIRNEYNKISSSVQLTDNAPWPHFDVFYESSCHTNSQSSRMNKCDGIKVGDVVTFDVDVVLRSCPNKQENWNTSFLIFPVGNVQELSVSVEMLCGCPCERFDHPGFEKNSSKCNGFGSLRCGVCDCDDFHHGLNCETFIDNRCRPHKSSTEVCSGRGICFHGQCECDKRPSAKEWISGKYCECDNFSCNRHNGLLCSGADHGSCECGSCLCRSGWSGDACECRTSLDTCRSKSGEICSGHGRCECGVCRCFAGKTGNYSGRFCENCLTCLSPCEKSKDCVQCQMYNTGPLASSEGMCAKHCGKFVPSAVDNVEVEEGDGDQLCTVYDDDGCKFEFVYRDSVELVVLAQRDRQCPVKEPNSNGTRTAEDHELFTADEIRVVLQDVFKGLKRCKSKEDQLQLIVALAAKHIYGTS